MKMKTEPITEKAVIFVCDGKSCRKEGCEKVLDELKKLIKDRNLKGKVQIRKCDCIGQCGDGPNALIFPPQLRCAKLKRKDAGALLDLAIAPKNDGKEAQDHRPQE